MSFSFGFSGDDVGDEHEMVAENENTPTSAGPESQFVGLPAEEHSLQDLVGIHVRLLCSLFHEPAGVYLAAPVHLVWLIESISLSFWLHSQPKRLPTTPPRQRKDESYLRYDA
jgi:hypothetical protein